MVAAGASAIGVIVEGVGLLAVMPATAAATNAVVATCVVLFPAAAVGAFGVPCNSGPVVTSLMLSVPLKAIAPKLPDESVLSSVVMLVAPCRVLRATPLLARCMALVVRTKALLPASSAPSACKSFRNLTGASVPTRRIK